MQDFSALVDAYRRRASENRPTAPLSPLAANLWTTLYPEIVASLSGIGPEDVDPIDESVESAVRLHVSASPDYEARDPIRVRVGRLTRLYPPKLRNGLLLIGPTGVGKTVLLRAIAEFHSFGNTGRGFRIVSAREIANAYADAGEKGISKFRTGPLGIDDLGTESQTAKSFGTEADPVVDVLLSRYDLFAKTGKPTYGTSNLTKTEIVDRYGERVSERIFEICDVYPFVGTSKRYKTA